MSEFQGCDKCKNVNKRPHEEPCVNCTHCAEEHFAPMTNADRIRNMSDEELADMMFESCVEKMGLEECRYSDGGIHECKKCVLEWLQAEVKEGDSNAS